jgi:hypothetical protein
MGIQQGLAQAQRALIGIESLRRMLPADAPPVESFAEYYMRQCWEQQGHSQGQIPTKVCVVVLHSSSFVYV